MIHLRILVVATLLGPIPLARASRPITHADLWLMFRVGAPKVSPDGKWIAFTVRTPDYDPAKDQTHLWIRGADGEQTPRELTHSKGDPGGFVWSPDSSRIAYSAKRDDDEHEQVYVLDLINGGEPERITTAKNGARAPRWSPDGKALSYVSDIPPSPGPQGNVRVYDGFPIRYWDHWLDGTVPHLFVQAAIRGAPARDLLAGTKLAENNGFGGRDGESKEEIDAVWSPDGAQIIIGVTAERDRVVDHPLSPVQLYLVPSSGGEPIRFTHDVDSYTDPQFTPDGQKLLVLANRGGDDETYRHPHLVVFDWGSGNGTKRVDITKDLDRAVSQFAPASDSKSVFFLAESDGNVKLYSVPTSGGEAHIYPLDGGSLSGLSVAKNVIVASHNSAMSPAEIARFEGGKKSWSPLTHFNATRLADLDLSPAESFSFTTKQGRIVQSFIVKPPGFDPAKKYPLFVAIHGGPHGMWHDSWNLGWNYQLLAASGCVILLPNHKGSSGFGEDFAGAIQSDPLRGPADEICQAADEAIKNYPFIDASRQAAGGGSYGGHLTNWIEASTSRFRCLVVHAGYVNQESMWATSDQIFHREALNGGPVWEQNEVWRTQNAVRLAGNHFNGSGWVTPMLVSAGERDFRVPINNAIETWSYLQRLKIPSRLLVFPDENHYLLKGEHSRYWYTQVDSWLHRWLD